MYILLSIQSILDKLFNCLSTTPTTLPPNAELETTYISQKWKWPEVISADHICRLFLPQKKGLDLVRLISWMMAGSCDIDY